MYASQNHPTTGLLFPKDVPFHFTLSRASSSMSLFFPRRVHTLGITITHGTHSAWCLVPPKLSKSSSVDLLKQSKHTSSGTVAHDQPPQDINQLALYTDERNKADEILPKKNKSHEAPPTSSCSATEPQIGRGMGSFVQRTTSTSMKSSASTTVSNSKPCRRVQISEKYRTVFANEANENGK